MKTIILIFSLTLITSCSHDAVSNLQYTPVNYSLIGKGALYGAGAEGIPKSDMVIDNNTDWQNLMNKMNTVNNETDKFIETNIDFNKYVIVAVFLEVKTNEWEVKITNIEENNRNILVSTEDAGSMATVMSQPFYIVKMPKTNKHVLFD
jgi:hypothetical protein